MPRRRDEPTAIAAWFKAAPLHQAQLMLGRLSGIVEGRLAATPTSPPTTQEPPPPAIKQPRRRRTNGPAVVAGASVSAATAEHYGV